MFRSGNSDMQASARLHMSTRTFSTGLWGDSDRVLECWQYFHCSGKANLCPGVIMILGHNLQVKYTKSFSASLLPALHTRSPESSPLPSWRQLWAFTWRVRRCYNSDLSSRCFFLGNTDNHWLGNTWRYGAKQYHMVHQNLLTNPINTDQPVSHQPNCTTGWWLQFQLSSSYHISVLPLM